MPVSITWSHAANSCPLLPVSGDLLDPADDAQAPTTAYQIGATTNGTAAQIVRPGLDANAKRIDNAGRYGGGGYAVCEGCELSVSATANSVDISPGAVALDAHVVVGQVNPATLHVPRLTLTEALTDNTTNHIWVLLDGSVSIRTDLMAPSTVACYLGRVVMAAGVITAIDYSGRLELRGGTLYRRTGDTGAPTDTPPARLQFQAETTGGIFWWTGGSYHKGVNAASVENTDLAASASALIVGAPTVTPGTQTSHTRPVTVQLKDAAGTNIAAKRLVRIWLSDAALGGETATVPDGGGSVTTGVLLKSETTNKHFLILTDAMGVAVIAITHSAAITYHVIAEIGGKITDTSVALT